MPAEPEDPARPSGSDDETGVRRLSRQYLPAVAAQATSRALGMVANFAALILIARVLGSETFGEYAFVMAFLAIALAAADLNTASVLARGVGRERGEAMSIFLGNFFLIRAGTTVTTTVVAAVLALVVKPELRAELLLCALAIPFLSSRVFDLIYQVHGRPWYAAQVNLIYSVAHIAATLVTVVWMQGPLIAYLWAWVGANVIYTVVAVALALRLVVPRFQPRWSELKAILALAAPLGVGTVFSIINGRADTFMIAAFRDIDEVAWYNAVYRLLDFGALATLTVLAPLIPIMTRALAEHRAIAQDTGEKIVELAGVMSLPAAVCAPFLAKEVIALLYGEDFREAAELLPIFGWLFVIVVYCLVGSVLNLAAGHVRHAYWNTALAVLVNISLNLYLIPRHGYIGAAWATTVSHLSLLAVSQYYCARNVGWLYRPSRWLRIGLLNLGLFLLMGLLTPAVGGLVATAIGAAVYIPVAHRLGLIPVDTLIARLRERRGARGGAPDAG